MKWQGENHLVGIGKNIGKDVMLGLVVGVVFFVLSKLVPSIGTIGLPPGTASIGDVYGKFLLVVIIAPIVEEVFFRGASLSFFDKQLKMSFLISALISSALFAGYHFVAYGSSISSASGSFVLAGVVGFGLCYLRKYSNSLTPGIIVHAVLNFLILNQLFGVVVF